MSHRDDLVLEDVQVSIFRRNEPLLSIGQDERLLTGSIDVRLVLLILLIVF